MEGFRVGTWKAAEQRKLMLFLITVRNSQYKASSEQLVKYGRTGTVTRCTEVCHFAIGFGRHPVTQHHGMYGMGVLRVDAEGPFRFYSFLKRSFLCSVE